MSATHMENLMDVLSILSAVGIKANEEDLDTICSLLNRQEALEPAMDNVMQLRAQLEVAESDLAKIQNGIAAAQSSIGAIKLRSQNSGLPIASCDHRSKAAAAIYFLRQRATVEPVHRAEIAQYVYGERTDSTLSRLSLILCTLKRKGMVRNGPRGYWFPLK